MKKLFFINCFTILFIGKIFGQAQVDIPLSATDGTLTYPLAVGLDLTATNCIDFWLGEDGGCVISDFCIIFDLTPYGCPQASSFKDYRAPGNPPVFPFTGTIEHTLWWGLSLPGTPIDITYNIPAGAAMYLRDQINGSFLNIGPFTGQGIVTIPGNYTYIFMKALLIMEYNNIIPVEFTSFTASILQNEKAVQLNWTTATETNNQGFEIERARLRSSNYAEASWNMIGFVQGFGTTTEPKSYSFTDENVTTGTYKYRLKQIDFDGTFNYSNEIKVEVDFTPKDFVLHQNYPNPFNPTTTIKYEIPLSSPLLKGESEAGGFVTLKVYDILGNEVAILVNEEKQPGVYEVEFIGTNLSSGVYYYKLSVGDFVQTRKMALTK